MNRPPIVDDFPAGMLRHGLAPRQHFCSRRSGDPLFHGAGVGLVTDATGPEETATRQRSEETDSGRDSRGMELWMTTTPSCCRSIRPGVFLINVPAPSSPAPAGCAFFLRHQ